MNFLSISQIVYMHKLVHFFLVILSLFLLFRTGRLYTALNRLLVVQNTRNVYTVFVRLAGENRPPRGGRLEINYNGFWGTVCRDYFDNNDVKVACYMLGFG